MFDHGGRHGCRIVDWEMTTVGDPLLDLAWALLGYDGENPAPMVLSGHAGHATRSELLGRYEKVSGLSTENIDYYLVLANWKLGIVLEKTYAAAVRSGPEKEELILRSPVLWLDDPRLIATAAELAGHYRQRTIEDPRWAMRISFSTSPTG